MDFLKLIEDKDLMVGETEEDLVPLHTFVNEKKIMDSRFVELLDHYIDGVAQNKDEYNILKTAFNMYSIAYMDINLRPNIDDSRSLDKYRKAKEKISQLFDEIESFNPEDITPYRKIQVEYDAVLEYIEQKINLLSTTKDGWKKIHRKNAENYLAQHNIKKYRHKNIFILFRKIMSDYSLPS